MISRACGNPVYIAINIADINDSSTVRYIDELEDYHANRTTN